MNEPVAFSEKPHLLPPKGYRSHTLALAILFIAPFLFGALVLALGQDANWDLRNYHWYNAYAFLNGRYDFDLLPSQTPWFYNPLLDVPFYLLATHVPAMVAGFVLGFVQGLNFLLLFMLAHVTLKTSNPKHKVFICTLLATLGMLGGGGIALLGTTFGDNITSLGIFTSALLVLRNFDVLMKADWPRAMCTACLIGIPAGLMMGLKLPSVIFSVGLCGAFVFATGPFKRRVLISFAFGIGVLIGVAITMGYWGWYLDTRFGSPLFPYFNNIFKSPLTSSDSIRDTEYMTHGVKEFFFLPFIIMKSSYRVGEIEWRDWRIPILYVLLPLAIVLRLVFGRTRHTHHAIATPYASRYLLGMAVIAYFAWLVMFCIYRYAVPLEMLAPLLIVLAAGMLPLRSAPRGMLTAFILLIIAASVQPGNWYRRASWIDGPFVQATIPPLGDTHDTMILMAGIEPYAHLLPEFPSEIPFVRIQSNFTNPEQDKGINSLIYDRVHQHTGPFMILIPPWEHGMAQNALYYFHLTGDWKSCRTVVDRLYDNRLFDLCPVTREEKSHAK